MTHAAGRRVHPDCHSERYRAQELGDCLTRFLEESGITFLMKHPELHEAWSEIVPPRVCERARISAFRRGTLEITVDSSPVMQEIQFMRKALLMELQSRVKKPFIAKLKFVVKARHEDYVGN